MSNTDTTSENEVEPIRLAELSDMKLTYDDSDGNRQEVRFDDDATDIETEQTTDDTEIGGLPSIQLPDNPTNTLY